MTFRRKLGSAIGVAAVLTWMPAGVQAADSEVGITENVFDDWGGGYCSTVTVSTTSTTPVAWTVSVPVDGVVTQSWNAAMVGSGKVVSATGVSWNRTVVEGADTQFGFCANRTAPAPAPTPTHSPHPSPSSGEYTDLAEFGMFHGNDHSMASDLMGGRTVITTEAVVAYNGVREFLGLGPVSIDQVGAWAFANGLTNNATARGTDQLG